jgi:hypothetical protein
VAGHRHRRLAIIGNVVYVIANNNPLPFMNEGYPRPRRFIMASRAGAVVSLIAVSVDVAHCTG